jgi:hypothetical protein
MIKIYFGYKNRLFFLMKRGKNHSFSGKIHIKMRIFIAINYAIFFNELRHLLGVFFWVLVLSIHLFSGVRPKCVK